MCYLYNERDTMSNKNIVNENFLLKTDTARHLYNDYAKNLPIIDYHCHINPQEIALNRKFDNITQVWLGGDHYKWRLIRSNGIDENEITGNADDRTKFGHFADMISKAIGNPMYHWTHLELKKYFGYDGILNSDTAEEVWQLCNSKLQEDSCTVRGLICQSNVAMIGTTDDPIDSLEWHIKIANDKSFKTKVVPSFRPDKAVNIDKAGFAEYIKKLSEASDTEINSVSHVKAALEKRLDFFKKLGCTASDHGLDYVVYNPCDDITLDGIFSRAMNGEAITQLEADMYKTSILLYLAEQYHDKNIVMQIHYGAIRNTNSKMFEKLGADTGFDCISTRPCGEAIIGFMNALECKGKLPKTILYSLNPQDNAMLDTYLGAFQGTQVAGKIQHGSAWWFNDTKRGMEEQLKSLADLSLLGNFIGMLTDSRSFLSYTRHDYFRRILCNLIGTWVEDGEYPDDEKQLKEIIQGICYYNAARYFGLN